MKITPIQIRQKSFEKSFRGYNIDEVDAFLHNLSVLWQENLEAFEILNKKYQKIKKEIQRFKQIEETLLKNIEISEKTASIIIKNAEMSAESINEQAQLKAKNLLENLNIDENKNAVLKKLDEFELLIKSHFKNK